MSYKKVTKKDVFKVASSIVEKGYDPTLANVRHFLGERGSQTTLHKYLKEWKQQCFKSALGEERGLGKSQVLVEEKRVLEQVLHQQKIQNEQYSKELIKAEKAILQLKMENQSLQKEIPRLQDELKEMSSLKNHFESLYETIKEERAAVYERELGEKNRFIEALQEELKSVNQQAIIELRNAGYDRDDAVMQEKVTIINLQEKIIRLTEENKWLFNDLNKAKSLNNQTTRKLEFYDKMLQECVPNEVREQYIQKTSLSEVNEQVGDV